MSMMIKVNVGEVRAAAQAFTKAASELEAQLNQVKQQVASLDPQWQDDAAAKFRASMPGHTQKVMKAIETFRMTAQKLNQAANQYEAMEKAAASRIRAS